LLCIFIALIAGKRPVLYLYFFIYIWLNNYWWYSDELFLYLGINIYISDILIAAVSLSTLLEYLKKHEDTPPSTVTQAMVFFLLWFAVCVIRGFISYEWSAIGESRFLLPSILYLSFAYLIKDMKQLKNFLLFACWMIALDFVYLQTWRYFYQFEGNLGEMFSSRLMGADTVLNIVMVSIFSLTFLYNKSLIKYKGLWLILFVLCAFSVPFGARTGWVSFVLSIILVIILSTSRMNIQKYLYSCLFMGLFVVVLWHSGIFAPSARLDIYSEKGLGFVMEEHRGEGTTAWRIMGWENLIWQTIRGNLFLGDGFGGYYDIFSIDFKGVPPHSEWLIIFAKTGVIGLLLFILVIIRSFTVGLKFIRETTDEEAQSYMKALLCTFFAGLVAGTFFFFFPTMWISLGLQTALINIKGKNPLDDIDLRISSTAAFLYSRSANFKLPYPRI
jgi:hypothetical protein